MKTASLETDRAKAYLEKLHHLANLAYQDAPNAADHKRARRKIIAEINALTHPIYSRLLYLRYARRRKFREIAVSLHYTDDYTRNLHSKALKLFYQQYLTDKRQPSLL